MTQTSRATRGTIITITSGKGGVGKTNVVVNLAASLARLGHRVGILDADFGLGNVDVVLGLTPAYHLGHYLSGERTLDEISVEGPRGVRIIPAGTGVRALTDLDAGQWQQLEAAIRAISADLDFLLVDTAAGISDNVVDLLLLSEHVLVVTSHEPAALVDAYAVIKILSRAEPAKEIGLVVNAARDADQAGLVFRQLDVATSRFLNRKVSYAGFIVQDTAVTESIHSQRAVVELQPKAPASRCFRMLASRVAGLAPRPAATRPGPSLRLVPVIDPSPGEEASQCA
jgi:flagellar biosynthesis protein FlhG